MTIRIGAVTTLGAAAITIVAAANRVAAQASEPYPGLDAYITKAVQAWKLPGLSVAIVRNDSVIFTKGYGVLAAGSTMAVNEKTLFEIGSSSKAFTATIAAMLVGDGKMHWDDRLTMYLPEFRMYDPVANEAVTLRDALTHRSGIARTGERPRLGYVPNATYPQVAAFLANYRKLQEMLNEICAINAELLRRRESLD